MDKTIQISTVPFLKLPEHDTIWAFIEGCDGRLYTGVCGEITGGMSAYVTGYDPLSGQVDYLCEMASTLGIPQDNGQATHSKVHKSLLQDEDGTIYAATHCTGAPVNDWIWRAWNCYNHPEKFFSGAGFVAMKNNGEVLYSKIILDREGSRCMALASKHRLIYGLSYPKNHFFVYDLETRETTDYGRIGNINAQCIFLDKEENGYTTDDFGKIVKFDVNKKRLEETGVQIPHAVYRNGYHNTVYDVTPSAEGDSVYGVTWTLGTRLFRYDFAENRLVDYGKAVGEEEEQWSHIIHSHAGGLVCAENGLLYLVVNRATEEGPKPFLAKFDPVTEERTVLSPLFCDGKWGDHISRGAVGSDGKLYFAEAGNTPTKLFVCDVGEKLIHNKTRRMWG